MEIPVKVQVIDLEKKNLILGTTFLQSIKGIIDFGERKLKIKYNGKQIKIPIYYSQENDSGSSESEREESESENKYEQYKEENELESYTANVTIYLAELNEKKDDEEFKKSLKIGSLEQKQEEILRNYY